MNILILGDVVGPAGVKAVKEKLPKIIREKKVDFVILNGENAADSGRGITKKIFEEFLEAGADVITTGNHVWDHKDAEDIASKNQKFLRPLNLPKDSPGNGEGIFLKNGKKFIVLNLMGNVFMKKCDDVFVEAKKFIDRFKLGNGKADFIIVDMHGEITSEKMAMGHLFDGKATMVVGTHTHVPTSDHRIMENGTAYQTDLGMSGDYNSVIGMNKDNSLKKFLKDSSAENHFPALGEATISGLLVTADDKTGLAKKVQPIILGGSLQERV
jgi:metallophosphoesterase (TIGR00282 family)